MKETRGETMKETRGETMKETRGETMKETTRTIQVKAYTDDEGNPVCGDCVFLEFDGYDIHCVHDDAHQVHIPGPSCPVWHGEGNEVMFFEDKQMNRYVIYDGSRSHHCCFKVTVMDSTKPEIIGGEHYEDNRGKHYETVCECFGMEDAELVCRALNALET